jgi:YidC/Oxa1 family membrane protein insertase
MNLFHILLYQPVFNLLAFLSLLFGGHLGLAIIALTIIIRLALFPSFRKTLEISKAQQELQPKIDEIRKLHKEDKEMQTKETMRIFQENKVNPFSSCLPTLVQLIVLIALYQVLLGGVTPEHLATDLYGFIPRPDNVYTNFLIFDLTKPDLWVLPLLAGGLQFIQSYMMTKNTKARVDKSAQSIMMGQMLYIFPIFTIIISRQFPAALALYWTVNTGFSAYQQYLVNHDLDLFGRKNSKKPGKVELKVSTKKPSKK